jgi:hypothetical protein
MFKVTAESQGTERSEEAVVVEAVAASDTGKKIYAVSPMVTFILFSLQPLSKWSVLLIFIL